MDKRDKLWLRILSILMMIFVLLAAFFAYQWGLHFEDSNKSVQTNLKEFRRDLDLKQQEIDTLKLQVEAISKNPPKDGVDGKNGFNGKPGEDGADGVTRVETHHTQTIIEKTLPSVPVEPLNGVDGKTPELAIDGDNNRWVMRYEGDEEWRLIPILCKALTVVCKMEP